MKKLAIFDFDGTLFDSIDDVLVCFNRALKVHDFPTLTREELIPCLGGNIDEIVSLVLGDNNNPQNLEKLKKTYLKFYNSSEKEKTLPFPFSWNILKDLEKKEVLLAVNSNRLSYSLEEFVMRYFGDFEFVLIEGHNGINPSKPNPYGVNRIIKKAGVSVDEALYIGDSITDIQTAQNAGIDCLIVKWGYANKRDLGNDYILDVVESPDEIINYF